MTGVLKVAGVGQLVLSRMAHTLPGKILNIEFLTIEVASAIPLQDGLNPLKLEFS